MFNIQIQSKQHNYDIDLKNGIFKDAFLCINERFKDSKCVYIVDQNVFTNHDHQIQDVLYGEEIIVLDMSERMKTLKTVEKIYKKLHQLHINRNDILVAIGGGVTSDLVGFVAATYLRGIKHINIPTTLLSMVDATIGGKVGVNFKGIKNQVGAFHAPAYVLIDPNFLKTLPKKQLRSGMAELIKVFYLRRPDLIEKLVEDAPYEHLIEYIYESLLIKKYYVENDEFEAGIRMFLNFGHTIGHALESYYRLNKYTHGEAVWIGMGVFLKGTKHETSYLKLSKKYHLPKKFPKIKKEIILDAIAFDKKVFGDDVTIVCFDDLDEPVLKNVKIEEMSYFL